MVFSKKLFKSLVCSLGMIVLFLRISQAEVIIRGAKIDVPPVIDGKLDDDCWKKGIPINKFKVINTKKPSKFETIGYILYDENNLYVGVKSLELDAGNIVTKERKLESGVFGDDCIEIMIDPGASRDEYYHFAINPSGSRYDGLREQGGYLQNAGWNGEWEAESHIGDKYWSTEVSIPYYALNINENVKSVWGINICRQEIKPFRENSSIAEDGVFHKAGKFPLIKDLDVKFNDYYYVLGNPEISKKIKEKKMQLNIKIPVKNVTGSDKEVKVECFIIEPSGDVALKSELVKLKDKEQKECMLGPLELKTAGDYDAVCHISVLDKRTKNKLRSSEIKIPMEFVPVGIRMIDPSYRDTIFETMKLEKIIFDVEINLSEKELKGADLDIKVIKKADKSVLAETSVSSPVISNKIEIPCKGLPYGEMIIHAGLVGEGHKLIAETEHRLQKLPYKKGEVWRGKDSNWYVDGKPFFFNGAWGAPNKHYNACSKYIGEGVKLINMELYGGLSIKFRKAIHEGEKITDEILDWYRNAVHRFKDNPDLFCYYLTDEPGVKQSWLDIYKLVCELDPYHPVIISSNNVESVKAYAGCADLDGFHCYPAILKDKRINDLSKIIFTMDSIVDFNRGKINKQTIMYMVQGFNYGDFLAANNRIPTYYELRNQYMLALICGAKGCLQFNRGDSHYPELYIGIPYLTQELGYIGKAVISPDSELKVQTDHDKLRTMFKNVQGELYLFAVNGSMELKKIKITIPGISKRSKKLNVISENRTVKIKRDSFIDKFDAFETHIYTTSREKTGLLSIKKICKEIDQVNQSRRKPGNLAFQMFDGDGVSLRASSTKAVRRNVGEENPLLWHVVDGIMDKEDACYLNWVDNTPDKFPDWIEIKLPRKHRISKVVVYPLDASLKDYTVQAFTSGQWKDVDKISNNDKEIITHKFKPVVTDTIRLYITAGNGPDTKITEIEIY